MFAHRIFVCFLALIIALAGFSLSDSSAYARELTVPDAKEEGWASQLTDYAFSCPVRIQSNLLGAKT